MNIELGENTSIINCSFHGSPNSVIRIGRFTNILNCSIRINGCLTIGNNCNIGGSLNIRHGASLKIGDYSGGKMVTIWCDEKITIGNHSQFAKNCLVADTNTHSLDWKIRRSAREKGIVEPKPRTNELIIEDDCWFGDGCKILSAKAGTKRMIIGSRTVVAAGAVVKRTLPGDSIFYSDNKIKDLAT